MNVIRASASTNNKQVHKLHPITLIRGSPRLLSALICVKRVTRDPVLWGGKVRLPQRPEVSSKQATPLPLPNRLRQPSSYTNYHKLNERNKGKCQPKKPVSNT